VNETSLSAAKVPYRLLNSRTCSKPSVVSERRDYYQAP
jgi:hypothetical protein